MNMYKQKSPAENSGARRKLNLERDFHNPDYLILINGASIAVFVHQFKQELVLFTVKHKIRKTATVPHPDLFDLNDFAIHKMHFHEVRKEQDFLNVALSKHLELRRGKPDTKSDAKTIFIQFINQGLLV